jgi:predicted Rossmann fold nucleotide-binding protein DprA/Smf involved in DNA uptake
MSTDLLSRIGKELDARLRELRPLVAEYERLLGAASALDVADEEENAPAAPGTAAPVRRRGRPPGKRSPVRSAAPPKPESPPAESAPAEPARAAKPSPRRGVAPKRAQRGAAAVAILAALEHGSHTVSELAVVTGMSGQVINSNLRRLQQAGAITRTKRAGDGKAAYALTAKSI